MPSKQFNVCLEITITKPEKALPGLPYEVRIDPERYDYSGPVTTIFCKDPLQGILDNIVGMIEGAVAKAEAEAAAAEAPDEEEDDADGE